MRIYNVIINIFCLCTLLITSCGNNSSSETHDYSYEQNIGTETYDIDNQSSQSQEIEFVNEVVQCPLCHGLGTCGGCASRGTYYSFGEWKTCDCCNGSGRCPSCDGIGKIVQPKWN